MAKGIVIEGGSNVRITNCSFDGLEVGVEIDGGDQHEVSTSRFNRCENAVIARGTNNFKANANSVSDEERDNGHPRRKNDWKSWLMTSSAIASIIGLFL